MQKWPTIGMLVAAELLSMGVWFSASAVVPALSVAWNLSDSGKAGLTLAVQGGFAPLFRLVVAPRMRRDIAESLAAMERRVRSRHRGSAPAVG